MFQAIIGFVSLPQHKQPKGYVAVGTRVVRNTGVNALAREVGMPVSTVSALMSAGLTPDQIRERAQAKGKVLAVGIEGYQPAGGTNKVPRRLTLPPGVRGVRDPRIQAAAVASTVVPVPTEGSVEYPGQSANNSVAETIVQAQLRKERALADLRELEYAQKSGELYPKVQVNQWIVGMIGRATARLGRIPNEVADRLVVMTDPVEVRELLESEIRQALKELREMEG